MQYESACDRLCENISTLLLGLRAPTPGAVHAAACATYDVAAAFHHAAGVPDDPRWSSAVASLKLFLDHCAWSPWLADLPALLELRAFVEENDTAARVPKLAFVGDGARFGARRAGKHYEFASAGV